MSSTGTLLEAMQMITSALEAQTVEKVIINAVEPFMEAVKNYVNQTVRVYTVEEVCDILKTSKTTVNALRDSNILLPIRIGSKDVYTEESIRKFLRDYEGANLSNKDSMRMEYQLHIQHNKSGPKVTLNNGLISQESLKSPFKPTKKGL